MQLMWHRTKEFAILTKSWVLLILLYQGSNLRKQTSYFLLWMLSNDIVILEISKKYGIWVLKFRLKKSGSLLWAPCPRIPVHSEVWAGLQFTALPLGPLVNWSTYWFTGPLFPLTSASHSPSFCIYLGSYCCDPQVSLMKSHVLHSRLIFNIFPLLCKS